MLYSVFRFPRIFGNLNTDPDPLGFYGEKRVCYLD